MANHDKKLVQEISKKLPDKILFNRLLNDDYAGVTNECLSQMLLVVDYLYDNQIPFRIEQTTSGGYLQLQAVTDSPKAKITLTGKDGHIDYIGSGVKASQRYAFTSTPYDASGRRSAGTSNVGKTFRPDAEDIKRLLDSYLKNDMSAFADPTKSRSLAFADGRTVSLPNVYYQNGKLKKAYKTLSYDEQPTSPVSKSDVELLIQPIQATIEGETTSLSNSVKILSNAIQNSRDYLTEEILKASDFIVGKAGIKNGNVTMTPSDYNIDNGRISDMVYDLQQAVADPDSEYGIRYVESPDDERAEELKHIIRDYISAEILGLAKDENGEFLELPIVDASDANFEADPSMVPDKFTLDPTEVSRWTALSENENTVVSYNRLQSSIRGLGLTKDAIVGDDNRNKPLADSLVKFDPSTAKTKDDFAVDSFERKILEHTESYLASMGITATCSYDTNGIINIEGTATNIINNRSNSINVNAQIGQIFAPDEKNVVHVKRDASGDFLFIPGYRAFVEENKEGENKNLMERTVLTGYLQSAFSYIDDTIAPIVNAVSKSFNTKVPSDVSVALPTACNSIYGEIYGTRLDIDYMETLTANGFDEQDIEAIYALYSGKIAFSKEMDKDATTISSIGGESQKTRALEIAGQNLREMGPECLGFVYPNMTNTGRGSGTRRYLCATARVADDGHIIKGDENDILSPLFQRPIFDGVDMNQLDRIVMAISAVTDAKAVDKQTNIAFVSTPYTTEDGYLIRERYGDSFEIEGIDGEKRHIARGDKLSDTNGNKGVTSYIIEEKYLDPNVPLTDEDKAYLEDKLLLEAVEIFRLNPDLDVILSPYSPMSRQNVNVANQMMKTSKELRLPDGRVIEGGIGQMPIMVLKQTVDSKTHTYDAESDHQRNSSGQISWMLSAKELDGIAREIYGGNEAGYGETRAYLNILGVTADEKGVLHMGFGADSATIGQGQLVSDMSEDDKSGLMKVKAFDEFVLDKNDKLQRKYSAEKWNAEAKDFNGLLQLPFAVYGADGKPLEMSVVNAYGQEQRVSVMPIVSAAYRSDIKQDNGEIYRHDYTKNYSSIIAAAGAYMSASTRLAKIISENAAKFGTLPDGFTQESFTKKLVDVFASREVVKSSKNAKGDLVESRIPEGFLEMVQVKGAPVDIHRLINATMKRAPEAQQKAYHEIRREQETHKIAGQSEYANILNDTIEKQFEERKHGAISSALVKVGCKHSATAVWSGDPTVPIDTIRMSQTMFDDLQIKDGNVLIWRDPALRTQAMGYFNVEIDNSLTGIAINPVMAKKMDGDFDGDSVAVVALQTPEAQREAQEKLSIRAMILDTDIGPNGKHCLALQDGVDVKATLSDRPELKAKWAELQARANADFDRDGIVSEKTFAEIDSMVRDIAKHTYCQNVLDFASTESLAHSLLGMTKEFGNGAKGSVGKMKEYFGYLGYDAAVDGNGGVTITEKPMSIGERLEHNRQTCIALGCKCDETGVAGYASQKAIRALRDVCAAEVLGLTYPVTQGMLQAKHDAKEALMKAEFTQNVIPDLWEGKKMMVNEDGRWVVEHSSTQTGRTVPMQATAEEWKDQFMRIMSQANGIGIDDSMSTEEVREKFSSIGNPDALDVVTKTMTGPDGRIRGLTEYAADNASFFDTALYGVASSSTGQKQTITEYIVSCAKQQVDMFSRGGEIFRPDSVRRAVAADGQTIPGGGSSSGGIRMDYDVEQEHQNDGSSFQM